MHIRKFSILILLLLASTHISQATHVVGGELTYQLHTFDTTSGNNFFEYDVTLTLML